MTTYFYPIHNTCTMFELGNPYLDKWDKKSNFLIKFDAYLKEKNLSSRAVKNYSILYNCVSDTLYKELTRIGFKHIGSYQGGHGSKVNILLFDCKKETKLSFWEWFNS